MRRNPEREAAILSMYRDDKTLQVIGDAHGISRERVRQIVRQAGEPVRRIGKGLRIDAARTAELYLSGKTLTECGAELQCSAHLVMESLNRQGIKRRKQGTRSTNFAGVSHGA